MTYEQLLQFVLNNGTLSSDRTGTGTLSVFRPPQIRYDLSQGFPIITTKKVHFKSIVHELLWIISGSTNTKYLSDNGVTIWNEWGDSNGNLGPVYGHQLRNMGGKLDNISQPLPNYSQFDSPKITVYGVGFLGIKKSEITEDMRFFLRKWRSMLKRCYSKGFQHYSYYGGKGVYVSDRWLSFINFYNDSKFIEGWNNSFDVELDKDLKGNGFCYSKETCTWLKPNDNKRATLHYEYVVEDLKGNRHSFRNSTEFREIHGIGNQGNFNSMLRGERALCEGFKLISRVDLNKGTDQLTKVIEQLKSAPESRRHVITLWNPEDLDKQALHCCHGTAIQFYVRNSEISMSMYQRSADMFLGVPFNIASYALFLEMIAQICGYKAKELIIDLGDAHIYTNHLEQVKEQLSRDPQKYSFPQLELNSVKELSQFKYEDIKLLGYESYPAIKGKVSV